MKRSGSAQCALQYIQPLIIYSDLIIENICLFSCMLIIRVIREINKFWSETDQSNLNMPTMNVFTTVKYFHNKNKGNLINNNQLHKGIQTVFLLYYYIFYCYLSYIL